MDAHKSDESPKTPHKTDRVWNDPQLLEELIDRAKRHGDRLVAVLFEASMQTLNTDREDAAYRQRVIEALTQYETQQDRHTSTAGKKQETSSKTDISQTLVSRWHTATVPPLTPPRAVSLFDMTEPSQTNKPETTCSDRDEDSIEKTQRALTLRQEAKEELSRPLMATAACLILLLLIGLGWMTRGEQMGLPQAVKAQDLILPQKPIPESGHTATSTALTQDTQISPASIIPPFSENRVEDEGLQNIDTNTEEIVEENIKEQPLHETDTPQSALNPKQTPTPAPHHGEAPDTSASWGFPWDDPSEAPWLSDAWWINLSLKLDDPATALLQHSPKP